MSLVAIIMGLGGEGRSVRAISLHIDGEIIGVVVLVMVP
jgi:hypothetical protein